MNLSKKKQLASQVLKTGKKRIHFNSENLAEIKEAITKQDIKDLHAEGIITIKPVKGRKRIRRRKTRRGPGKIKKTVRKRKQVYVKITRKLREYLKHLKESGLITNELFLKLRKKIRMRDFRSKAHLKEHLEGLDEVDLHEVVVSKPKPKIKKKIVKKTDKTISSKTSSDEMNSLSEKSDSEKKIKDKPKEKK